MTRLEHIQKRQNEIQPGIKGCALVSKNADAFPCQHEEDPFAGMTTSLMKFKSRTFKKIDCGNLQEVWIKAGKGYEATMTATEDTVLTVFTHNQLNWIRFFSS